MISSTDLAKFAKILPTKLTKSGHSIYLVVSLLEQLDGGEALDLDVLQLVGGGVHLGDDDVVRVGELLAELVPDGDELLAVA